MSRWGSLSRLRTRFPVLELTRMAPDYTPSESLAQQDLLWLARAVAPEPAVTPELTALPVTARD